jgi:hypothetical protein
MQKLFWLVSIPYLSLALLAFPAGADDLDLSNNPLAVVDHQLQLKIENRSVKQFGDRPTPSLKKKSLDTEDVNSEPPGKTTLPILASNSPILPTTKPVSSPKLLADNEQVQLLQPPAPGGNSLKVSPGLSISNPIGFGADNNVAFLAASYQSRTRGTTTRDGELGLGVGLGDAVNSVGVEISYSINSFGSSNGFGTGGFNAKVHKRLSENTAVAIGWNRFLNITNERGTGIQTDFPRNSYYAVASHIIRTKDGPDDFLSRIGLSAGIGGGQFLPYSVTSTTLDAGGLNVFGSVALRIAKPVSAIVEWTGQDLAAGLSITPLGEDFPLVITPAFRDITGVSGERRRFVLGVGTGFKF